MSQINNTFEYNGVSYEFDIRDAENSEKFEEFRNRMRNSCTACEKRALCFGGCPLMSEVVLCDEKFL